MSWINVSLCNYTLPATFSLAFLIQIQHSCAFVLSHFTVWVCSINHCSMIHHKCTAELAEAISFYMVCNVKSFEAFHEE